MENNKPQSSPLSEDEKVSQIIDRYIQSEPLATFLKLCDFFEINDPYEITRLIRDKKNWPANGEKILSILLKRGKETKTEHDFQIILEREFRKTGLNANIENKLYYYGKLIKDLEIDIARHEVITPLNEQHHSIIILTTRFIVWLRNEIEFLKLGMQPGNRIQVQTSKVNHPPASPPTTFEELFIRPELIEDCLKLLKETDPATISDENRFLRKKGNVILWFLILEKKGMFNYHFENDVQRADFLESSIENFRVSPGLFRSDNITAKENYEAYFQTEITTIKKS